MSKIRVVAAREFLTTIRRPAYIVTTAGMPVFALLIIGISIIPAYVIAKKEARASFVGLVDEAGVLGVTTEISYKPGLPSEVEDLVATGLASTNASNPLAAGGSIPFDAGGTKSGTFTLRPYASSEEARQALRTGEIGSVMELGPDYLATGRVTVCRKGSILTSGASAGGDLLRRFVVERLLRGRVDDAILERVRSPLRVTTLMLQNDGSFQPQDIVKEVAGLAVPLAFTLVFFLSVMMSSGFLLQGVSEEKENRVIEVILSSIRAEDLLAGKLIGLGGAGLLQIAIWVGMVLLPAAAFVPRLQLNPWALAASLVFYVLGFLLFGVLLTGTGSLGQNLKESQQYGMMWSFGSVIPMMFLMLIISEPNGMFARILSFIPLTAPTTMFLRLNGSDPPVWWETLLVGLLLAAATWAVHRVMAKLFRVGLLLYGKSPTIPEIVRLLRRPAP